MDDHPASLPGHQLRHAHSEPSSARIDVTINEHPSVPGDADLDAQHGRDPGDSPKTAPKLTANTAPK
jgi:hypothetical protein